MRFLHITSSIIISLLVTLNVYSSEPLLSINAPVVDIQNQLTTRTTNLNPSFEQDADLIRSTYEARLYTLPAFKSGHYGLRMYRQTLDNKYAAAIWSDMARVASRLNFFANEVHTPEQIRKYAEQRVEGYLGEESERSQLRYQITKEMPEYLYLGVDLLGSMARANEYGLQHLENNRLKQIIRRYDFTKYATNEAMIKAWAAQLANQVYWLRQLGEQDVVEEFITTFRKVYPDAMDNSLSEQQFGNKIYGLTHIIFAASAYYQHSVREQDHQWLFDYYRDNIDTIIARAKEDVVAEVGINFLLAGLDNDPVVLKTRKVIQQSLNRDQGLVPSVTGGVDLKKGEHRNVLAIMLLDWKGVHAAPTISQQPELFRSKPYGLVAKD
ncbi:DUF3541 domain-containing protein [Vibrio sp. 1-Bac 57]